MALPKYVKITKDGVEYISGLDRCQYTIKELSRAALRDVGKYICTEARKLIPRWTGYAKWNIQYWVRQNQQYPDLQVGYKWNFKSKGEVKVARGFYAMEYEYGDSRWRKEKKSPLYSTTSKSIATIRQIEGQYLSAIEDENRALGLIDEEETISDET